ncbi:HIT family protein [Arthrobacter sp. ISL-5]|uniref:HIT family protein n=1 Tax=Arthrobacter sp. ISL-5 TaxID=2819111 RepID=UPI001BE544F2|nr:HIT family protein [Arthrobacter sp. ISL-5]MBT2555550.1 HIT family protein [Arthrobacter sp. ISL-5]
MDAVSPFLSIPEDVWLASNALTFAFFDTNPTSPGHALIVPRRPIASWFDASADEQTAALALLGSVKRELGRRFKPHGYNVGFNDGAAAGQTVFHAHLHVIPRYTNDVIDPRGGVRHAVIGRGYYGN